LSDEEFERLKTSCEAHGARSISDFARTSVLERIDELAAAQGKPRDRVQMLNGKVAELEVRVGQLLNLLAATGESVSPATVDSQMEATV
jgi:hypothetical protein